MNRLQGSVIPTGLVVQRDVAPGHRRVESPAGIGNAPTSHRQLPVALGCLRRWKVEVVGDRQRFRTNAAEISSCLSHSRQGASVGIEGHPTVRAIHCGGNTPLNPSQRTLALLRPETHNSGISRP